MAFRVIDSVVNREGSNKEPSEKKNPAAVALGRLGGKKGGPARAAVLSERRRRNIARQAANARWHKVED